MCRICDILSLTIMTIGCCSTRPEFGRVVIVSVDATGRAEFDGKASVRLRDRCVLCGLLFPPKRKSLSQISDLFGE